MNITREIYLIGMFVIIMIILVPTIAIHLNQNYSEPIKIQIDKDYIKLVDKLCYNTHNPNSTSNYRESWGISYRICILENLNIEVK